MILKLVGHEYKYAVEQIMLTLFPLEKPVYSEDPISHLSDPLSRSCDIISGSGDLDNRSAAPTPCPCDLFAESRLSCGPVFAQCTTIIRSGNKSFRGVAKISRDKLTDKLVTDRLLQRIIKQSFYRSASNIITNPPVWGSLTGIRPAQIAAKIMEKGKSAGFAANKLEREYYVSPVRAKMCVSAAQTAIDLKQSLKPKDIALYIGIPFCPTRCTYCSFVSNSVEKSFGMIKPFVKTLLSEIEAAAKLVREYDLQVSSIYIGGGTPTTLPTDSLDAMMSAISRSFDLQNIREYTFEAGRPETITQEKLQIIRQYGADRICVNPQSMSDKVLTAIGRNHSSKDVLNAVQLVKNYGFYLNLDVIAGLPSDSLNGFKDTIDTILTLNPENVTIHTLSLKKGSKIMLEKTSLPSGTDVGKMLDYAAIKLGKCGFEPYYLYRQKFTSGGFENTGWCMPGHEGIYNICMMEELCTVLALGGGGATKLVNTNGRIERIFNAKYPKEYISLNDKLAAKYDAIRDFMQH